MGLFRSLSGMLTVEFTSAEPEKTLEQIVLDRIPLSHVVQKKELTYEIQIQRKDYRRLTELLLRLGNSWIIVRKQGLYWPLKAFARRPVLMSLLVFLLLSSFYLPSRIFFLSVEGNQDIPERLILSAAEDCGIRFAASRKHVRSEKVKNALLSAVPQLQWAGINTYGCRAVISVRERREEEPLTHQNQVSSLIADRDGFILSATVTAGTPHCAPGDTVTRGQVLVSGYTDCGICIRASRAEGEILAQTSRKLTAVTPAYYAATAMTSEPKYKISLVVGKKRINLWKDSRISDTTCDRMYEEYYVSLPGRFQLPVAICVDQYFDYDLQDAAASEAIAQRKLQEFSEDYLMQQMISGQVIQKQHHLMHSKTLYILESSYVCTEMIGKERREQIGVMNGKGY